MLRDLTRVLRKHVLADLRPYICTFERCGMLMFEDKTAWFDHEMTEHRREWVCSFCEGVGFLQPQHLERHMAAAHQEFTSAERQILLDGSARPLSEIPATHCRLCPWEEALQPLNETSAAHSVISVTPQEFKKHLAWHLEQLALFALPRVADEPDNEDCSDDARGGSDLSSNMPSIHSELSVLASPGRLDIYKVQWANIDKHEQSRFALQIHVVAKVVLRAIERRDTRRSKLIRQPWASLPELSHEKTLFHTRAKRHPTPKESHRPRKKPQKSTVYTRPGASYKPRKFGTDFDATGMRTFDLLGPGRRTYAGPQNDRPDRFPGPSRHSHHGYYEIAHSMQGNMRGVGASDMTPAGRVEGRRAALRRHDLHQGQARDEASNTLHIGRLEGNGSRMPPSPYTQRFAPLDPHSIRRPPHPSATTQVDRYSSHEPSIPPFAASFYSESRLAGQPQQADTCSLHQVQIHKDLPYGQNTNHVSDPVKAQNWSYPLHEGSEAEHVQTGDRARSAFSEPPESGDWRDNHSQVSPGRSPRANGRTRL